MLDKITNQETGPKDPERIRGIGKALDYLEAVSIGGEQLYGRRLRKALVSGILRATGAKNSLGRLLTSWFDDNPTPNSALHAEALLTTEGEKGIEGIKGVHKQKIKLKKLAWFSGTKHFKQDMSAQPSTSKLLKKLRVQSDNPDLEHILESQTITPSKNSLVQPLLTKFIEEAESRFSGTKHPNIQSNMTDGSRSLDFGELTKFDPKNKLVRLVVRVTDPKMHQDDFRFIDLDKNTYQDMLSGKYHNHNLTEHDRDQSLQNALLLSSLVVDGVLVEDLDKYTTQGLDLQPLDNWYYGSSPLITLGARHNTEISAHPLSVIEDPRVATQILIDTQIHNQQATPTQLNVNFGHSSVTGKPGHQYIADCVSDLSELNPLDPQDHATPVNEYYASAEYMHNTDLNSIAPQLAKDQAQLYYDSHAHSGAAEFARLINLASLEIEFTIPSEAIQKSVKEIDKYNQYLEFLGVEGFNENTKISRPIFFLMGALKTSKIAPFLSVIPDAGRDLPNALEMTTFGNKLLDTVNTIVSTTQAHINSNPNRALDITESLDDRKILGPLLNHLKQFSEEIARSKGGKSTAAMLAYLTSEDREPLEGGSALTTPQMANQLQGSNHVSGLGLSDSRLRERSEKIVFTSATSKSVTTTEGMIDNSFDVIHTPDDPLTIWEIIDKYGDVSFYQGLYQHLLSKSIDEMDTHEIGTMLWIKGKIDEFRNIDKIVKEEIIQERESLSKKGLPVNFTITDLMQSKILQFRHIDIPLRLSLTQIDIGRYPKEGSGFTDQTRSYTNVTTMLDLAGEQADVRNDAIKVANHLVKNVTEYLQKSEKDNVLSTVRKTALREIYKATIASRAVESLADTALVAYGIQTYYKTLAVQKMMDLAKRGTTIDPQLCPPALVDLYSLCQMEYGKDQTVYSETLANDSAFPDAMTRVTQHVVNQVDAEDDSLYSWLVEHADPIRGDAATLHAYVEYIGLQSLGMKDESQASRFEIASNF